MSPNTKPLGLYHLCYSPRGYSYARLNSNRFEFNAFEFHRGISTGDLGVPLPAVIDGLRLPLLVSQGDRLAQFLDGSIFVLDLAALLGAHRRKTAGSINSTYAGFHLVDILTAISTGAEGFKGDQAFVKCLQFCNGAFAEIQKPILPPVARPVGALPYPLD